MAGENKRFGFVAALGGHDASQRGAALHLFERVGLARVQLDAVERRDDGCEFGDSFVAQR